MSRVAILGAGDVGRAIATGLVRGGHQVVFGSRGLDRTTDEGIAVRGYRDAAVGADAIVLAVPGDALGDVLATHAALLDGQLLLDATNRIDLEVFHQLPLFAAHTPNARVARVWCSMGWTNFITTSRNGEAFDLLWCGPDGADGTLITDLVASTGLRPVRTGGLETANIVEYATRLTLSLIFQAGFPHETGLRVLGR